MANCNVCKMRILSHSVFLKCSVCKGFVHIKCIPHIDKNDSSFIEDNNDNWLGNCCSEHIFPFNQVCDDDDFLRNLSEYWDDNLENILANSSHHNRIFIPFEINDDESSPLFDADPDVNFYQGIQNNNMNTCDYYYENSFNKKCRDLNLTDNNLSFLHSNIRSMPRNLDRFEEYMSNINTKFSFIGFSETWLKPENENCYGLSGYVAEHNSRVHKVGGGVSLYIKDGIQYTKRDDLCNMSTVAETVFIEIDKDVFRYDNNIIVGVLYRPPDTDISKFNEFMKDLTSKIKTECKSCYILGDYNVNLLNADNHSPTQEFVDTMYSKSLFPSIIKPTRVTRHTGTLIDNIFCNDVLYKNSFVGILYSDISDHFPVFYIDNTVCKAESEEQILKRIYSSQNINKFMDALDTQDWTQVISCNDAQQSYTLFHTQFSLLYENCFPKRVIKRNYKNRKPWLTEGLKKSIRIKNSLFILSKKHNSEEMESNYKKYRNRLTTLLRNAERDHYDSLLKKYKSNLKKSWAVIKDVINRKKFGKTCSKFYINNKCVSNKTLIADSFNSYFINIGPNLASHIPDVVGESPLDMMGDRVLHSIFINPVVESEVESIIKLLKPSSPGWDSISADVVKVTRKSFIVPLTHIMNMSLTTGIFPSELKIARVIPILKAGDPMQFSNYRPVSVLPLFSKILERLMYNRVIAFINKHKLLYAFQFGFREGYSTDLAMLYLVDKISDAIESGDYVLGLFLDFTKAFDTVNHKILLQKLDYYGIRGTALKWFDSYISKREQYVDFEGVSSTKKFISCGVPQGSILGPLLFLLYINDIANVSSLLFSLLFADDSNMFLSGKDPNELIRIMNTEIDKTIKWLNINKLTLNVKKTHYMIFRKTKNKLQLTESLAINGETIGMVKDTKFLGMIIDDTLSWKEHIKYICGKIARGTGIICKCRKYFKEATLVTMYYSFVYPYLCYCINIWGNTYDSYLDPLIKLQKRIVRLITNSTRYAHTKPLFLRLKMMNLSQIYIYSVQLFMFKYYHLSLPDIFSQFFTPNEEIHRYDTRQRKEYHAVRVQSSLTNRLIRYTGVKLHNYFHTILDYNCSIHCYKKHLRSHILSDNMMITL